MKFTRNQSLSAKIICRHPHCERVAYTNTYKTCNGTSWKGKAARRRAEKVSITQQKPLKNKYTHSAVARVASVQAESFSREESGPTAALLACINHSRCYYRRTNWDFYTRLNLCVIVIAFICVHGRSAEWVREKGRRNVQPRAVAPRRGPQGQRGAPKRHHPQHHHPAERRHQSRHCPFTSEFSPWFG